MDNLMIDISWNLKDKFIIITGATSGIGLAAAKQLVIRGAKVGIVARNQSKANEVAAELMNLADNGNNVDVFIADMASQQSIRQVASEILTRWQKIDILINNAGALYETRQLTDDGIEMTWAVNHLGPFLLTTLLLDRLKESKHARIITTASHGHKMAKDGINFDDLSAERFYKFPKKYTGGPTFRYAETKLANILFTSELKEQLKGTGVSAYCYDPGLVATNFNQNNGVLARMTMSVMKLFSRTPEKGAETLVWLAESNEITEQSGNYYTDMEISIPSVPAQNKKDAKRLWEVSKEQTRYSNTY